MNIPDMVPAPQRLAIKAWIYFAIAASLVTAGAAGGYGLASLVKGGEIASLKQEKAETKAAGATAALADLTAASASIAAAAKRYAGTQSTLGAQIAQLREDLKNAPTPLPADCKPDAYRVLKLDTAISAAIKAASGQPLGGALPAAGTAR